MTATRDDVPTATVEEAIADYRQGRMVIIVDDEERENEGDLALAAEHVTPEAINFMAMYGRGLVCLTADRRAPRRAEAGTDGAGEHLAHGDGVHYLD